MGEDVDGAAESVSKLREEILALSGVDIMIDDSTFKDTYDIMLELSRVWSSLTDTTQANILEKLGGKRGANVIASILTNTKDLEAAYKAAQEAEGSALAENQKYLESIEGRLSQLSATWQEFWDNAINTDLIKNAISLLNRLLQLLNDVGGLKTIVVTAGFLAFKNNLGGITDKVNSLILAVPKLAKAFANLRSQMKTNNVGLFDLFNTKNDWSTQGIVKSAANLYADTYNATYDPLKNNSIEARTAAHDALIRSYDNLCDESKKFIDAMGSEAAQHNTLITTEKRAAAVEQAYTAQKKAGKLATEALTVAQKALNVALSIGASLLIGKIISDINTRITKQKELTQEIIDNGKAQAEQARTIRLAAKEFDKANDEYAQGKISSDEFRQSVEKLNEALGDQAVKLAALKPGTEEYRAALQKIIDEQNALASASAHASLYNATQDKLTATQESKRTWWSVGLGALGAVGGGIAGFLIGGPAGGAAGAKLGAGLGGAAGAAAGYFGSAALMDTTSKSKLSEYANAQKNIDRLTETLKNLNEVRRQALSIGDRDWLERIDKEIENINDLIYKNSAILSDNSDAVSEILELGANYLSEATNLRDVETTLDYYREIEPVLNSLIDTYNLGADSAYLFRKALAKDARFAVFESTISQAEEFLESTDLVKLSLDQLIEGFDEAEIAMLNSAKFKEYLAANNLKRESIDDLRYSLELYQQEIREVERAENTLSKALNSNKESIDTYQEMMSKLGGLISADYTNNAGGMIDAFQELLELIPQIAGKGEVDEFIEKINSMGFTSETIKQVSEELAELSFDNLVEVLNIDDPALLTALKQIYNEALNIDSVTSGLSGFKSAYESLIGVIKDYNENGMMTADNIQTILNMDKEYLKALKVENGQLVLNKEVLADIAVARLEEVKAEIEQNKQTQISALYKEQERRNSERAAEATLDLANSQLMMAETAGVATEGVSELTSAIKDMQDQIEQNEGDRILLDADLEEEKRRIEDLAALEIDNINNVQDALKAGSFESLDAFLGTTNKMEDVTKDTAKELKSAIDSVKSYFKSALDAGAITYKDYLDRLVRLRNEYGSKLNEEDALNLDLDVAQARVDLELAKKTAAENYIDRNHIKPLEKEKSLLEEQKEQLEENRKAVEEYYDAITEGLSKEQKQLEDTVEAIEKSYEAQIKPLEKEQKLINKRMKLLEKQKKVIEAQRKDLEKQKRPYESQQDENDKLIKQLEREVKAIEKTKKPYEDQQKAIDKQVKSIEKEIKGIEKEIKAIQYTEKPYKDEQKEIEKTVRAIEEKISALEDLKKPYQDQIDSINQEVKALEKEVTLLERTKAPYEQRKQAIDNEIAAIEYEIAVKQRAEKVYKREQDLLAKEAELIQRQVDELEHRKKPYEIAQREIQRQITLLEREQSALEDLKKPYKDEIEALEKEKDALAKANEERKDALELQQAEYNLRRAQQQRTNLVYQGGQFQYVADQQAIKDAQQKIDDLNYEKSVRKIEDAIDSLQDKIDEITAQGDLIQDAIDDLTKKNEELEMSIEDIQYAIDPLQDQIDELNYRSSELGWSIQDVEYTLTDLQYRIEDLGEESADLVEAIRLIDEKIQPFNDRINELNYSIDELQSEIDLIQAKIDPLNTEIDEWNKRNEELQRLIDEIEDSLEPLNERIDELNDQISDFNEQSDDIQETIDAIDEAIEPLQQRIDDLNEANEDLQVHIDEIDEKIKILEEDLEPINDELEELSDRSSDLGDQIDDLKDKQEAETEVLKEQIETIKDQIDTYNDLKDAAVAAIDEEIGKLDERATAIQKQIDKIQEYKQSFQDFVDAVQAQDEEELLRQTGWIDRLNSLDPTVPEEFGRRYTTAMDELKDVHTRIINSLGDVETQLNDTTTASDNLKDSLSNATDATGQGSVLYALDSTSVHALEAAGVFGETTLTAEDLKDSLNTYHSRNTSEVDGLIDLLDAARHTAMQARDEFDLTSQAAERLKETVHKEIFEILADIELMVNRVKSAQDEIFYSLDETLKEVEAKAWEIKRITDELGEDVDGVLAHIIDAFAVAEERSVEGANAIIKATDMISEAWGNLKGNVESSVSEINNFLSDSAQKMKDIAQEAANTSYEIMKGGMSNIMQSGQTGYHTAGGTSDGMRQSGGGATVQAPTNSTTNYHTSGNTASSTYGNVRTSGGGNSNQPTTAYKGVKNIKETALRTKTGQKKVAEWRAQGYDIQVVDNWGKIKGNIQRLSKGGVVSFRKSGINIDNANVLRSIARSVGEDTVVAAKDGERVLTKSQNEGFEKLIKLTPELINATESLAKYAKMFGNLSLENAMIVEDGMARSFSKMRKGMDMENMSRGITSMSIGDIYVTDAKDADDLAIQIKRNLPNAMLQALGKVG